MRLILLGAEGMFGRDAAPALREAGFEVIPGDLPAVDIADEGSLKAFLDDHRADVILNAAAYTNVDGAESERRQAFRVNGEGPRLLAEECGERRTVLVHLSTDYVFPGAKAEGYAPDDAPGPAANAYGASKLAGEEAIRAILPPDRFLICRTQWLYGRHGRNFVDTMAGLLRERNEVRVVNDQWGAPTCTIDLAKQVAALLAAGARGHAHTVGGGGPVTWYDLALEIARLTRSAARVIPCTSAEFPRPARRPAHAWLRNTSVPESAVRPWRRALAEHLEGDPRAG